MIIIIIIIIIIFSDCLLQILLVRAPGVGNALPHDLVLFLLPAAVACTEIDSSEYAYTGST